MDNHEVNAAASILDRGFNNRANAENARMAGIIPMMPAEKLFTSISKPVDLTVYPAVRC